MTKNLIQNTSSLSKTKLRSNALAIIESGLHAIDTKIVIKNSLKVKGSFLFIKNRSYDLDHYRRIYLLALGKNSFSAAWELKHLLKKRLNGGIILSQQRGKIASLENFQCSHPHPSKANQKATQKVINFLKTLQEEDLLLVVISGGGSAMLTAPHKISVTKKAKVAKTLMDSGADINELNIVRKHLSLVKGGRLAELSYPATVAALVFSDVVGDNLSTIASGPLVMDHSTVEEAQAILKKYKILQKLRIKNLELAETPKDSKFFSKVHHYLLLTNETSLQAMEVSAQKLGYEARVLSRNLSGEARSVGKKLLSAAKKGEALLAAGETTVIIKGDGVGGRCQELVLGNLEDIKEGQLLIAVNSDGHDNSDFAGALGDKLTLEKAAKKKLKIEKFLQKNDSYSFFKQVDSGIETGKLESNIADLMLVLSES